MTSKKTTAFLLIWGTFLKIKAYVKHHFCPNSPKLAQIFPYLPEKKKKHDIQKQKERPQFAFGCHFYKIRAHAAILRIFSQIFPKFPQILPGV